MKTLAQFQKSQPSVSEGLRVLNEISPKTSITYVSYRGWVAGERAIGIPYKTILLMKGLKP